MPELDYELIAQDCLQSELRSGGNDMILLDCRSSNEYTDSHIRSAVNFSIPSIMLRRLAAGKLELMSTIKSKELKERIGNAYKTHLFILYNDNQFNIGGNNSAATINDDISDGENSGVGGDNNRSQIIQDINCANSGHGGTGNICGGFSFIENSMDSTINVLYRRLKQDGCRVVCLQDGFTHFRDAYPEWCEDDSNQSQEIESSRTASQADQLMGLRSLRISLPHIDSACSSSTESSDCETSIHHNFNEAPVEIIPGLFLGNAQHSKDLEALQKYNIKFVLNVTPDLPNVFEASGGIQYLKIPIIDHYSQDLAVHFPTAIHFIEMARQKDSSVLVHCLAGVSRSVTVTLAYLMHSRDLNLNDAFTLVRDRKPDVSPNFHFMEQLHSFEQRLRLSPRSITSTNSTIKACNNRFPSNKFTCNCVESNCKCLINADFLANAKATGVSPDSGIEFDRWTPSDAATNK